MDRINIGLSKLSSSRGHQEVSADYQQIGNSNILKADSGEIKIDTKKLGQSLETSSSLMLNSLQKSLSESRLSRTLTPNKSDLGYTYDRVIKDKSNISNWQRLTDQSKIYKKALTKNLATRMESVQDNFKPDSSIHAMMTGIKDLMGILADFHKFLGTAETEQLQQLLAISMDIEAAATKNTDIADQLSSFNGHKAHQDISTTSWPHLNTVLTSSTNKGLHAYTNFAAQLVSVSTGLSSGSSVKTIRVTTKNPFSKLFSSGKQAFKKTGDEWVGNAVGGAKLGANTVAKGMGDRNEHIKKMRENYKNAGFTSGSGLIASVGVAKRFGLAATTSGAQMSIGLVGGTLGLGAGIAKAAFSVPATLYFGKPTNNMSVEYSSGKLTIPKSLTQEVTKKFIEQTKTIGDFPNTDAGIQKHLRSMVGKYQALAQKDQDKKDPQIQNSLTELKKSIIEQVNSRMDDILSNADSIKEFASLHYHTGIEFGANEDAFNNELTIDTGAVFFSKLKELAEFTSSSGIDLADSLDSLRTSFNNQYQIDEHQDGWSFSSSKAGAEDSFASVSVDNVTETIDTPFKELMKASVITQDLLIQLKNFAGQEKNDIQLNLLSQTVQDYLITSLNINRANLNEQTKLSDLLFLCNTIEDQGTNIFDEVANFRDDQTQSNFKTAMKSLTKFSQLKNNISDSDYYDMLRSLLRKGEESFLQINEAAILDMCNEMLKTTDSNLSEMIGKIRKRNQMVSTFLDQNKIGLDKNKIAKFAAMAEHINILDPNSTIREANMEELIVLYFEQNPQYLLELPSSADDPNQLDISNLNERLALEISKVAKTRGESYITSEEAKDKFIDKRKLKSALQTQDYVHTRENIMAAKLNFALNDAEKSRLVSEELEALKTISDHRSFRDYKKQLEEAKKSYDRLSGKISFPLRSQNPMRFSPLDSIESTHAKNRKKYEASKKALEAKIPSGDPPVSNCSPELKAFLKTSSPITYDPETPINTILEKTSTIRLQNAVQGLRSGGSIQTFGKAALKLDLTKSFTKGRETKTYGNIEYTSEETLHELRNKLIANFNDIKAQLDTEALNVQTLIDTFRKMQYELSECKLSEINDEAIKQTIQHIIGKMEEKGLTATGITIGKIFENFSQSLSKDPDLESKLKQDITGRELKLKTLQHELSSPKYSRKESFLLEPNLTQKSKLLLERDFDLNAVKTVANLKTANETLSFFTGDDSVGFSEGPKTAEFLANKLLNENGEILHRTFGDLNSLVGGTSDCRYNQLIAGLNDLYRKVTDSDSDPDAGTTLEYLKDALTDKKSQLPSLSLKDHTYLVRTEEFKNAAIKEMEQMLGNLDEGDQLDAEKIRELFGTHAKKECKDALKGFMQKRGLTPNDSRKGSSTINTWVTQINTSIENMRTETSQPILKFITKKGAPGIKEPTEEQIKSFNLMFSTPKARTEMLKNSILSSFKETIGIDSTIFEDAIDFNSDEIKNLMASELTVENMNALRTEIADQLREPSNLMKLQEKFITDPKSTLENIAKFEQILVNMSNNVDFFGKVNNNRDQIISDLLHDGIAKEMHNSAEETKTDLTHLKDLMDQTQLTTALTKLMMPAAVGVSGVAGLVVNEELLDEMSPEDFSNMDQEGTDLADGLSLRGGAKGSEAFEEKGEIDIDAREEWEFINNVAKKITTQLGSVQTTEWKEEIKTHAINALIASTSDIASSEGGQRKISAKLLNEQTTQIGLKLGMTPEQIVDDIKIKQLKKLEEMPSSDETMVLANQAHQDVITNLADIIASSTGTLNKPLETLDSFLFLSSESPDKFKAQVALTLLTNGENLKSVEGEGVVRLELDQANCKKITELLSKDSEFDGLKISDIFGGVNLNLDDKPLTQFMKDAQEAYGLAFGGSIEGGYTLEDLNKALHPDFTAAFEKLNTQLEQVSADGSPVTAESILTLPIPEELKNQQIMQFLDGEKRNDNCAKIIKTAAEALFGDADLTTCTTHLQELTFDQLQALAKIKIDCTQSPLRLDAPKTLLNSPDKIREALGLFIGRDNTVEISKAVSTLLFGSAAALGAETPEFLKTGDTLETVLNANMFPMILTDINSGDKAITDIMSSGEFNKNLKTAVLMAQFPALMDDKLTKLVTGNFNADVQSIDPKEFLRGTDEDEIKTILELNKIRTNKPISLGEFYKKSRKKAIGPDFDIPIEIVKKILPDPSQDINDQVADFKRFMDENATKDAVISTLNKSDLNGIEILAKTCPNKKIGMLKDLNCFKDAKFGNFHLLKKDDGTPFLLNDGQIKNLTFENIHNITKVLKEMPGLKAPSDPSAPPNYEELANFIMELESTENENLKTAVEDSLKSLKDLIDGEEILNKFFGIKGFKFNRDAEPDVLIETLKDQIKAKIIADSNVSCLPDELFNALTGLDPHIIGNRAAMMKLDVTFDPKYSVVSNGYKGYLKGINQNLKTLQATLTAVKNKGDDTESIGKEIEKAQKTIDTELKTLSYCLQKIGEKNQALTKTLKNNLAAWITEFISLQPNDKMIKEISTQIKIEDIDIAPKIQMYRLNYIDDLKKVFTGDISEIDKDTMNTPAINYKLSEDSDCENLYQQFEELVEIRRIFDSTDISPETATVGEMAEFLKSCKVSQEDIDNFIPNEGDLWKLNIPLRLVHDEHFKVSGAYSGRDMTIGELGLAKIQDVKSFSDSNISELRSKRNIIFQQFVKAQEKAQEVKAQYDVDQSLTGGLEEKGAVDIRELLNRYNNKLAVENLRKENILGNEKTLRDLASDLDMDPNEIDITRIENITAAFQGKQVEVGGDTNSVSVIKSIAENDRGELTATIISIDKKGKLKEVQPSVPLSSILKPSTSDTKATIPLAPTPQQTEVERIQDQIRTQRVIIQDNEAAKTFLETKVGISPFDDPAVTDTQSKPVQVILEKAIDFLNSEENNINSNPDNYQDHLQRLKDNLSKFKIGLNLSDTDWSSDQVATSPQLKLPNDLKTNLEGILGQHMPKKEALDRAEGELATLKTQLEAAQEALDTAKNEQKMQTSPEKQTLLGKVLEALVPEDKRGDKTKNFNLLNKLTFDDQRNRSSLNEVLKVLGKNGDRITSDSRGNLGNLPDGIKLPDRESYSTVQEELLKAITNETFDPLPILKFLANPQNFRAAT